MTQTTRVYFFAGALLASFLLGNLLAPKSNSYISSAYAKPTNLKQCTDRCFLERYFCVANGIKNSTCSLNGTACISACAEKYPQK